MRLIILEHDNQVTMSQRAYFAKPVGQGSIPIRS